MVDFEVEARHPAEWVRIEGEPRTPSVYSPRKAHVFFHQPTAYVYNTAIWRAQSVSLTFADDFSGVTVLCDDSVDDST